MADLVVYRLKEIVTYEIIRVELSEPDGDGGFSRSEIKRPFARPMSLLKAQQRIERLAKRDAKHLGKEAIRIVGTAKNWHSLIREKAPNWWF